MRVLPATIRFDEIGRAYEIHPTSTNDFSVHRFMGIEPVVGQNYSETRGYVVFNCVGMPSYVVGAYWRTDDGLFRVKMLDGRTDLVKRLIDIISFFKTNTLILTEI